LELKTLSGPNPACPQRGPYETSEGIYPVMGKRKLGEGKSLGSFGIAVLSYGLLLRSDD